MHSARVVFFTLVFALMAMGVWAQVCPPVTTPAPQAPVTVSPAPTYFPPSCAAVGAGPAQQLQNLSGPAFDRAYIETMYQTNVDISTLATQGIEQTTDKNLRDLSIKIRGERTAQNEKLAMWYRDMGLGRVPVDYSRVGTVVNCLTATGPGFDAVYAQTMSDLMTQERDGAQLGVTRTTMPEMRNQAGIVVRTAQNEITALQRWIGERMTPAGGGAGTTQYIW